MKLKTTFKYNEQYKLCGGFISAKDVSDHDAVSHAYSEPYSFDSGRTGCVNMKYADRTYYSEPNSYNKPYMLDMRWL